MPRTTKESLVSDIRSLTEDDTLTSPTDLSDFNKHQLERIRELVDVAFYNGKQVGIESVGRPWWLERLK